MSKKTKLLSTPCDTVFAMIWSPTYKGWTISDTLAVWHEHASPQDFYHVRKKDIQGLKELKKMSFSDLFTQMIFCVQDEQDIMHMLAPFEYNKDDIAFVKTAGEPPATCSPST